MQYFHIAHNTSFYTHIFCTSLVFEGDCNVRVTLETMIMENLGGGGGGEGDKVYY